MRVLRLVLGACVFLSCFPAVVSARQNSVTPTPSDSTPPVVTAAITGAVTDKAGAIVAGATVTVANGSGFTQETSSDDQGLYALMDLSAGKYTLTVTVKGETIYKGEVTLNPGQVLTLNVSPSTAALTSQTSEAAPQGAEPSPGPAGSKTAGNIGGGDASMTGVVSDQTGASVVGATVKISNASGTVGETVSDDKGAYTFKGLPAGTYTLSVSAKGFKTYEAAGVALAAGQALALDAGLEPAGEKTEVTVEGQKVAQVETETAQVSGTITEKEVLTLGLNGRNFTQLIALTPGVSNQTGQDEAKVGVTGSVKYSVNGGRVEYNTFEVDGGDVLNAGLNGAESTLMVYPSLDAIQEVKVLTSNYGAMYGRTASGTVLVTTKSGLPQWHGSGYEFIRNEYFNARNYFDQTKKAPLYRRNDFGFTIWGQRFIPHLYK